MAQILTGEAKEALPRLRLTAERILEDFTLDCENRHMEESTIHRYRSGLHQFLQFLMDRGIDVLLVDKHVLRDFIQYRRVKERVKQKTIENDFSALALLYDYLEFEDYIPKNPVPAVRKRYLIRYKEEDEDTPRQLISVEQMAMLVGSILSIRDKCVVLLLAKTGLRRRELISIDLSDIDWKDQSITLKRQRFKKRSNRTVFFDDETSRVLQSWLRTRSTLSSKTEALFLNERQGRLNRNGVYNIVTKYAQAVGLHDPKSENPLDHFTPHCCRHWFTTHLRKAGMDREFIKVLRGDARKESMSVYDHVDMEELRRSYLAKIPQLGF